MCSSVVGGSRPRRVLMLRHIPPACHARAPADRRCPPVPAASSGCPDLNRGPQPPKGCALPTAPHPAGQQPTLPADRPRTRCSTGVRDPKPWLPPALRAAAALGQIGVGAGPGGGGGVAGPLLAHGGQ